MATVFLKTKTTQGSSHIIKEKIDPANYGAVKSVPRNYENPLWLGFDFKEM